MACLFFCACFSLISGHVRLNIFFTTGGTRAGLTQSRKLRPIPVLCGQRARGNINTVLNSSPRPRCLTSIQRVSDTASLPLSVPCAITNRCFTSAPTLYVLNTTSLAKPHAIQQLHTDIIAAGAQVVVIGETWFKKKHDENITSVQGFVCYQRDRVGRVGGGVAIYVTDSVDSNIYNPLGDYNTFEILWVKCKINSVDCFIAGLYHPPKPLYPVPDLFNFLSCTIDSIVDNYTNSCIVIAGDCNTLSDSSFFDLGLLLSVKVPTHKGHFLDKIFVNQPLYQNVKAVRSSIKTEHAALIAKSDCSTIVDVNKTRTAVTFRKPTPAKSASFLSGAQPIDWAPVLNSTDVQAATDSFYVLANQLLDTFFPLNHVTLSSRDPPYITPTIKHLLRLKID